MTRIFTFLLLILSITAVQGANRLPTDPDVRIGTLPNGLTYYLRHNSWPEKRADFFLAQRVGSVNENENQRGLAHFIEHMCFNGTRHFPGNTLITYLESLGVKFGANLNAYTSTDETVYNICDVPTSRVSALDSCLLILRDWSHDLTLDSKEIDAERGVIKGEWRQRQDNPANRMLEKAAPKIYAGSIYGLRLPIGSMDVIEHFRHDELRDYYARWYHPQNQCVIVVGDIDINRTEQIIRNLWRDIERPSHNATPATLTIPDNDTIIVALQSDPEQTASIIQLYIKHPQIDSVQANTIAELRRDLAADLMCTMLAGRFDEIEHNPDAPFTNLGIGDTKFMLSRIQKALLVRALANTGRERDCVQSFAHELKRAAFHGFTDTELERAKLTFRSQIDSEFANREKTTNTVYARKYVRHYLDGGPLLSTEQYYKMMKGVINRVTLEDVNTYTASIVKADNSNVVIIGYLPQSDSSAVNSAALVEAYTGVNGANLPPYTDKTVAGSLLTAQPVPGTIVAESENTLFNSTIWTLSNGIKVHIKHTDSNPDQIIVQGFSPGGFSQNYNPALAADYHLANDAIAISSFGGFTSSELSKLLVGKKISSTASIEPMEERIGVSASPAYLKSALQLLYLKATDIHPDTTAFKAMIENKRIRLSSQNTNVTFAMGDSIHYHVYNRHPLGAKLKAADLDSVNYNRILDLYRDRFADMTDFTFYIVGNFNTDTLREYVTDYIASLPAAGRMESPQDIDYRYTPESLYLKFTRHMATPQTIAYIFYHTPCDYNLTNVVTGHALGSILQSKMRRELRENRGWTYGVKTHCGLSAGMNGHDAPRLIMPVYIRVAPENATATFSTVAEIIASASDPANISTEELRNVTRYMQKSYEQNITDNTYWLTVMHMYDKFGRDMHNGYTSILQSLTPETLADFARRYFSTSATKIRLEMSPQ